MSVEAKLPKRAKRLVTEQPQTVAVVKSSSSDSEYQVIVKKTGRSFIYVDCSCPNQRAGSCKHIEAMFGESKRGVGPSNVSVTEFGRKLRDVARGVCTWQQAVRIGARRKRPQTKKKYAEMAVELFNEASTEGQRCRFWPAAREDEPRIGTIRMPAWIIGSHASVRVHEYAGGIALSHIELIDGA